MTHIQIVKDSFSAIEAGDFATLEKLLHKDYQLSGPVPNPVGRKDLVTMLKSLKGGLPDFAFNLSDLKETKGQVSGILHVTGTHSQTLDLSFMGAPPQPPTGKMVKMPDEPFTADFIGDRLSKLNVEPVEGGGMPGLLNQVGVSIETPV